TDGRPVSTKIGAFISTSKATLTACKTSLLIRSNAYEETTSTKALPYGQIPPQAERHPRPGHQPSDQRGLVCRRCRNLTQPRIGLKPSGEKFGKLTMREIDQEIAGSRREKDPLYGQTRRISFVLSERMYRQLKAVADTDTGGSIIEADKLRCR